MRNAARNQRGHYVSPGRVSAVEGLTNRVISRSEKDDSAPVYGPPTRETHRRIKDINELNAHERAVASEAAKQESRAELAIRHLAWFMVEAWSIVEPNRQLTWNWHYDILCDELEKVARGKRKRLVICVPPGTGKTITVQVMFTAWYWLHHPERRVLALSANQKAINKASVSTRELIESPWYQSLVERLAERGEGQRWQLKDDDNQKTAYHNTMGGFREAVPYKGKITGSRPDGIIVDDPSDVKDVLGKPEDVLRRLDDVADLFDGSIKQRIDPKIGWRIVIMQRIHERDLAGDLLKRGWPSVVLPMMYDPEEKLYKHPKDPRTKAGELLFEKRFDAKWCKDQRTEGRLTEQMWLAQYQQRPSPTQGRLFKRPWFAHRYTEKPERLAKTMEELAISVDATFKNTAGSDRVSMQVWGRRGPNRYLLDSVCDHMNFPETMEALLDLRTKWSGVKLILIEDKANGPALIASLKTHISGVIGYDPKGSKYARAQTTAVIWEGGNVWLPDESLNLPWVSGYIEEHVLFPASHDDQVDATSQILGRWDANKTLTAEEVMKPMRELNEAMRKAGPILGNRGGGGPRRR